MKFGIKKNKLATYNMAIARQAVLFFLLFNFICTIIFPTVISVARYTVCQSQFSTQLETPSSLAEFIIEDCLQVYDDTLDGQETDFSDIEELYDEEVDWLNEEGSYMFFQAGICEITKYTQDQYPLIFSCYLSATPPPEC